MSSSEKTGAASSSSRRPLCQGLSKLLKCSVLTRLGPLQRVPVLCCIPSSRPEGQAGPFSPGSPSELVLQIQKPRGDILPKLPGHPPAHPPRPCWLWTDRCPCTELPMGLELPWLKTQASVVRQPWPGHSAPARALLPGLSLPPRPQARLLQP